MAMSNPPCTGVIVGIPLTPSVRRISRGCTSNCILRGSFMRKNDRVGTCHTSSQTQARVSIQHLPPTSLDTLSLTHVTQAPLRCETILLKQYYRFRMASRDEYARCALEWQRQDMQE